VEGDGGWKAGFDGEGSFWWLSLGRGFGCLFFGPRFSSAFFFFFCFDLWCVLTVLSGLNMESSCDQ